MNKIYMIERGSYSDYRFDFEIDEDYGFFLTQEDAEKKVNELSQRGKESYEKYLSDMTKRVKEGEAKYQQYLAQKQLLEDAGQTPIAVMEAPSSRYVWSLDDFLNHTGHATYRVIEISLGELV
jgi:hypothetical protein